METQKIVSLLNGSDNDNSKFETKKQYIIDSEIKGDYSQNDEIKFLTGSKNQVFVIILMHIFQLQEILQQHQIMQLHKQYLKIVHHLINVEQK